MSILLNFHLFQGRRPDHNVARKWRERNEEKISVNGPSFTISGTVVGPVGFNEGTFGSDIDNFFQGPSEQKLIGPTKKLRKSKIISIVNEADNEKDKVWFSH